jgi:hypothetical protein
VPSIHSTNVNFNCYDLLASAAKAAEVWFPFGMAEAMPLQNSSTADSSVAQRTRSVGMTKL